MKSRQEGAALVIALLILVVISILGVSAMRMSMFNARISTGAQGSAMSFQAAETALQAVGEEALDADLGGADNVMMRAMRMKFVNGITEIQWRCVTSTNAFKPGACGADDLMDSREFLQAESQTVMKDGYRRVLDNTVSETGGTGGSSLMVWYDFVTVAEGDMQPMDIQSYNVQEFSRKGLFVGENF